MFPRRLTRGGGFTLVEILVVVVILGIASAIIIPQIGSRDDLVVSAAARVVMADLIYAQNRAIATQRPHYVRFNGQQYSVSDQTSLVPITHPVSQNPFTVAFGGSGTPLEGASLGAWGFGGPDTIGFDELGSPFAFSGTGTSALATDGTISIRNKSGSVALKISIEPFTGEATVQ
jgi:prepilin-type N-terminal cleavage/methylation domain-containing protein